MREPWVFNPNFSSRMLDAELSARHQVRLNARCHLLLNSNQVLYWNIYVHHLDSLLDMNINLVNFKKTMPVRSEFSCRCDGYAALRTKACLFYSTLLLRGMACDLASIFPITWSLFCVRLENNPFVFFSKLNQTSEN